MQKQIDGLNEKIEECKEDVHGQLKKGHKRMDTFENNLKNIERKLDIVLEFFDSFEGFFRVMGWIGKLAVWATKISIFLGGVWLVVKDHIK